MLTDVAFLVNKEAQFSVTMWKTKMEVMNVGEMRSWKLEFNLLKF